MICQRNLSDALSGCGTMVEKFRVGSRKQFSPQYDRKSYRKNFEVYNIAANGYFNGFEYPALWKNFVPYYGHIVVRVYEGGEQYQVFVLDSKVPDYHVLYKTDIVDMCLSSPLSD